MNNDCQLPAMQLNAPREANNPQDDQWGWQ
jgi:hypothetical protein